jgi:predicted glycoside hydrolase/deacetylase ChbG (UPF0249 family)
LPTTRNYFDYLDFHNHSHISRAVISGWENSAHESSTLSSRLSPTRKARDKRHVASTASVTRLAFDLKVKHESQDATLSPDQSNASLAASRGFLICFALPKTRV